MDIALGKEAVNLLSQARLNKIPLPRLPEKLRPKNESEAYYIQSLFHKYLVSSGYGNISGRKIGCTSEVMQNYLGIKTPCVGAIYSSGIQKIHGKFLFDDFIRPGVECEIAVILGTDLGDNGFEYDRNSVEPFVSSVMCAIEIVDDRWIDYKSVDTYSLISDDFFGSGCVVGEYKDPASINLREINGRILVRDKLVGMHKIITSVSINTGKQSGLLFDVNLIPSDMWKTEFRCWTRDRPDMTRNPPESITF